MSATTDSVVTTRKLTKVFRDFWLREKVTAVAELDLDIHPREVYGLLGPNGSGKSTTLKMVLGLLFPTSGRIGIFGRQPTDVAVKSRIGFLPEESYLYPFLDARETLDFYGRLFHQPRRERQRRIDMLLEMVGLSGAAYRRVGEYSKGMQRRIGLAQALINDPDLLILDEPISGMDPIGTRQFKDIIRTLALRGKTVILSSHLLADVEDVCDRVCILYGGRKRAEGTIDELLAQDARTQITTPRLDEATLQRVQAVLAEAAGDEVEVTTPRTKLEDLFLQIVTEAQRQRLATGGAVGGGQVAAFLRGQESDEGEAVIDELVAAGRQDETPDEPSAPEPPAAPHERVDTDEIAQLIDADDTDDTDEQPQTVPASSRTESAEDADLRRAAEQADRNVIEDLLGGSQDDEQEDRR